MNGQRLQAPRGELRVVGFEGALAPQRVPARLAAIIVDAENCRVVARNGSFERLSDEPIVQLPSTATRVEPPLEAVHDSNFLVLAAPDVDLWRHAARTGSSLDPESVRQRTRDVGEGAYTAWLCTPIEAQAVLTLLGEATSRDLADAFRASDRFKLYELGWRMVRCAVSDDDIFLAAAALAASPHPERAQFALCGYFPAMDAAERDFRLTRARQRLEQLANLFIPPIDDPPPKPVQHFPIYSGWEIAA